MSASYNPRSLVAPRFFRNRRFAEVASTNERQVLRQVWRSPGLSRAEVITRLSLTQQSVHRIVDNLVQRGQVALGQPVPSRRGQPSPSLHLNPDFTFTIGISVNTDRAGVSLMNFAGNPVTEVIRTEGLDMATALDRIEEVMLRLIKRAGLAVDGMFGIGFGIAGYLLDTTRYNAPLPLQEWSLIELGPLLSRRFDTPVWTDNGANTAAICETLFGTGRYTPDFAYLSFNYGFGGAIVMNGELLQGGHGNAGEFSGMYDVVASSHRPALKFLIERLNARGVEISSIYELRRSFDPSWPGVPEWLDEVTPAYNSLINAICAIVDPQAIVLGGEMPRELAEMFILRTEFYNRPRYGVPRRVARLLISEVAGGASASGAAALPLKAEFF